MNDTKLGLRPSTRAALTAAAALCALAVAASAKADVRPALMPMPREVEQVEGTLRLDARLEANIQGCAQGMVSSATTRFLRDVVTLAGSPLGSGTVPLAIRCLSHDSNALGIGAREGYRLSVAASGISIEADGEAGVLRALATLRQLVGRDARGRMIPAVRISDAPRFAWRGVMIDTARHFVSVATIKRQIDAMELAKLNVLHLHLSDNEGFRVESRVFPKLTTIASHGEYYTQNEIRELVRYASDRGVRIVPEFDLPGHSHALLTAYPELAVAPIDPKDPLAKPKSALNPASERTYRFLEKLIGEMAPLFPDRQFHVGGDEVSDVAWAGSAEVEAMKARYGLKTKIEVEARFHERLRKILAAQGKTTVGWDEMADTPLPRDVIVQAWRSSNPLSTATAKGNRVIVSAGFYINDLRTAEYYYGHDMLDPMAYSTMSAEILANVRKNPVTAAQVSDGLVARPVPPLTPEQEKLVIGGEGPLWAEGVNDELLDGRLWPRGLALAERFWSSAALTDTTDMYARMLPVMEQLRSLGLADDSRRRAMVSRLAPDAPEVVLRLVDLVAPTRLGANHVEAMMGGTPDLVELTDAASTDGSPARRFRVDVAAFLAGDKSRGMLLRTAMRGWIDNRPAFEKVAAGRPLLEKAIPTARDLADLAQLGLAALDAIELGKPLAVRPSNDGQELLRKLRDYEAASADFGAIARLKQPPAALIILPAPDVARLVEVARKLR
ncbi:family 20 glycosylhydrolase [Novosphingobium sp. PS1R-30]|uniref:beta-N-acetylhexosaminidase n=1 Tax=Novosphingobium anseongense TaxID=3133436 RepID=A0ABU8S1T9_9SPHN